MSKLDDILERMTDLGTERVDKHLIAQVYGKPGVGKTVLAVGLAKYISGDQRVLYIDTKEGWVSLDNHDGLKDGVTRYQLDSFLDLPQIAEAIRTGALPNIGTVVIDELSTAAEVRLEEIVRSTLGLRPSQQVPADFDAKLYAPMGADLVRVLNAFHATGVHLIVTAHEREIVDHRKVKVTKPDYSPKAGAGIQRLFHLSAHVTNEVTGKSDAATFERLVQSHPSGLVDAKSRIGGLPVKTDTATFVQVVHDWLYDETATLTPEDYSLTAEDVLPTEGIPVADDDVPVEEDVDA